MAVKRHVLYFLAIQLAVFVIFVNNNNRRLDAAMVASTECSQKWKRKKRQFF